MEAEDVDGEPGRGAGGEEAGDDDAAIAVDGDFFDLEAAAAKVALEVGDGLAEAAAAGEVEVGVVEGPGSAGQGEAVDTRSCAGRGGGGEEDQERQAGRAHGPTIPAAGRRCYPAAMSRVALVIVVALCGCKEGKEKDKEPAEPPTEEPAAAKDAAPVKPAKPVMLNKMKNCPSAIAGVHTTIEPGEGVVSAIVIGKDKPATEEIRERAKRVAAGGAKAVADPKHTGEGTGGAVGKCPARAPGATAVVTEITGGAKLTFTPAKPEEAGAIAEMLRARAKALNERGGRPHGSGSGRGAGGGHGGHGSSGRGGQ